MTPEEQARIQQLCILIQSEEEDNSKVSGLVNELNELLERKERRFPEDQRKDPLL